MAAKSAGEVRPTSCLSSASFANTSESSITKRSAFFLPRPETLLRRLPSLVATITASCCGVNVESTERASLGPTPEIARKRSKSARSSREANPKSSIESSLTTIRVKTVTPASPACGSAAAVEVDMPSSYPTPLTSRTATEGVTDTSVPVSWTIIVVFFPFQARWFLQD